MSGRVGPLPPSFINTYSLDFDGVDDNVYLQNLTSRLRDYIGDVEAYEGPDFDLFHSDKTTVVVVCSKYDFENIIKKQKDAELIMIKTNPLCEIIQ